MPVLCAAVLLDMNGTFMFQGDRFGTDQDYAATYRTLGGRQLATVWIDRRGTGPAPGRSPTGSCVTSWSCSSRGEDLLAPAAITPAA